jgi:hypothetical protein
MISWAVPPLPEPVFLISKWQNIISSMYQHIKKSHPGTKEKHSHGMKWKNIYSSDENTSLKNWFDRMKWKSCPRWGIMWEVMNRVNMLHDARMMNSSMHPIKICIIIHDEKENTSPKIYPSIL